MNKPIELKFIPVVPIEQRCSVCGDLSVKAEFLCDMPIGITFPISTGRLMKIEFKKKVLTCDKKLCKKCTTKVNGFDFCPDCIKKIKLATKGV